MVRILLKGILYSLLAILIILVLLVGPIDRTPLEEQDAYRQTMAMLDTASLRRSPFDTLESVWGKVNITPDHPMPLAGYTLRENFTDVHDSLYCRILGFRNNNQTTFIISADLLLFPPVIRDRIEAHFGNQNIFFFYSATHTHNGVGGWHSSVVGNFALGEFDELWVSKTVNQLTSKIENLQRKFLPATVYWYEADAQGFSENRVNPESPADTKLRGLQVIRSDHQKAILVTFSAHPTSISKKSLSLSGDYPGALVRSLENNSFDFGIFLGGMVGSHRLTGIEEREFEMVEKAGQIFSEKIKAATPKTEIETGALQTMKVPIEFGNAQLRLSKDWKLRNWVFEALIGDLQGELTVLQIGSILLIGTPCDFSGEISVTNRLDSLARSQNKNLIITSFNGDYCGYITADHHYDQSTKEEIRALNWVGPYYGRYFSEAIQKIINKQ